MALTLYLCDRQRESCLKSAAGCWDECMHTASTKHAINGPCKDPIKHRERFKAISVNGVIEFWEREDYRK